MQHPTMKSLLIGVATMAVCAAFASATRAESREKQPPATLRVAAEAPPLARFADEHFLLSPPRGVRRPLPPAEEPVAPVGREGHGVSLGALELREEPTGLVDEVLFGEARTWRILALGFHEDNPQGISAGDWSGLAIGSTVGE